MQQRPGRVLRLDILERAAPTFGGDAFAEVGAYECLNASAFCDLDPTHPLNQAIVNLAHAPRDAGGCVAYRVDVCLIKPINLARGNGWLLYELPNRGTKRAIQRINNAPPSNRPASRADVGNGFLMRRGFTLAWSGWQGELARDPGRMLCDLPIATDGGRPITGTAREEFILDAAGVVREDTNAPLVEIDATRFVAPLHYPAADLDPRAATLTLRVRPGDPRVASPGLSWRWLDPMRIEITRPEGFDRGAIFEFIYTARDPIVLGVGLAAIRDVVAFLRHEAADAAGNPNPMARAGRSALDRVLGLGISQSGRVLRDFLLEGFNDDGAGRPVFDAVMPVVAGSRRAFLNAPFGQVSRFSRQHEDHDFPGDQFPFGYVHLRDPVSGQEGGILDRARGAGVSPKVMHLDTAAEIWSSRSSLVATDCTGADLALPDDVRLYLASSLPHGPFKLPEAVASLASNLLGYGVFLRALLDAMIAWVERGIEPPASRFPSRAAGTLLTLAEAQARWPHIPGVGFPAALNALEARDHTAVPPKTRGSYAVFVEATDDDGNGFAGLLHPLLMAPVGTHTGWQLRRPGYAEGDLFNVFGGFIPFAATAVERAATGDPRRSLAERYGTLAGWREALAERMRTAVAERVLLQEDADRVLERAAASWTIFDAV
jgi:hypothetical protein